MNITKEVIIVSILINLVSAGLFLLILKLTAKYSAKQRSEKKKLLDEQEKILSRLQTDRTFFQFYSTQYITCQFVSIRFSTIFPPLIILSILTSPLWLKGLMLVLALIGMMFFFQSWKREKKFRGPLFALYKTQYKNHVE